ncbi:hypothetical protein BDA99DRAFT_134043 [Phascolomyces articulosus]|uniref:C2H2-type domain-containing protein n=1 Tax=Phascolomyces articulosus TaxID=60185 RepID=A0AAD5JW08_9FUNG|nr:hypothetical protein BDA99DRAFT_134043 [Phascolomyces articulosus]
MDDLCLENIEKQIKRYKKSSYLPPTEQTTVTTDQQPKEVLYYCPYQRCRYSAVSRYSFSNHIRKKHDPKFQVLKSSKHVTFKSVSGRTINLNNSGDARDKLKHGDKLSLEDLFSSKEKTVMYYCPYRKCVFPYASLRNARRHFRKTHNVIVPEIKLNKRNLHTVLRAFKTPSGRILDFDENSRDLLDDENDTKTEMIMIKKTVETKENSTKNYCCPYKSCDFNSSTNRQIDVFNHIRYHHDHYFNPYSYEISPHFIFKNPQGKPIYFNEKSRATINYGERISVFFNKRFTQRLK